MSCDGLSVLLASHGELGVARRRLTKVTRFMASSKVLGEETVKGGGNQGGDGSEEGK